jgi:DNA-nicking Smr family endonuclease
MTKKKGKDKRGKSEEAELPKFGGFHQLAALSDFKKKMEAEAKAAEDAAKARGAAPPPKPKPAAPASLPKKAQGDGDDELTFHRMMAGVTPLDAGKASRVPVSEGARSATRARPKPDELRDQARREAEEVRAHLHQLVDDVARFEVSDDGRRVEGRRVDVAPDVLRTLRRGLLPIDARLDLHGMDAATARDRLLAFLREKRTTGERCVLVIHGKGDRTPGGGVLRGEIAAWLSQGRAREHVAAFATAREDDGGEGAVYVALRR